MITKCMAICPTCGRTCGLASPHGEWHQCLTDSCPAEWTIQKDISRSEVDTEKNIGCTCDVDGLCRAPHLIDAVREVGAAEAPTKLSSFVAEKLGAAEAPKPDLAPSPLECCRRQFENIIYCLDRPPVLLDSVRAYAEAGMRLCEARLAAAPSDEQIEKEGELRDLPEDFWQWSMELQRGWIWKRCLALQQLADLAGGAALNLIRKQGGSNG